ncbi:CemA-like proton extrusion protein-like protein [Actinidia rufa]|uniref:CemA-like proton extrusion protein-like protein n=1 Tax=Actinidia rufa TaxID=165716 RepID=A0A7J0HF97_9ERIC|nr:CemA-like proton extrusion protein-like protein [Actinidia rufa]
MLVAIEGRGEVVVDGWGRDGVVKERWGGVVNDGRAVVKGQRGWKSMYPHNLSNIAVRLSGGRRQLRIFAPNVKNSHSRKRSWWKKFFFNDEGNWLGLKDDDILEGEEFDGSSGQELSEGEKFEAWKRRAEAIIELREAQADLRNQENCRWED